MTDPKKPGADGFYRNTVFRKELASIVQLAADAENKEKSKHEKSINFDMTDSDMRLCWEIAQRAQVIAQSLGNNTFNVVLMTADIACCHCNGTPLHLLRFLMADNADFMFDFAGIATHLNRTTGELMHGFKPIFGVLKS